jgi:hypothetical protein
VEARQTAIENQAELTVSLGREWTITAAAGAGIFSLAFQVSALLASRSLSGNHLSP